MTDNKNYENYIHFVNQLNNYDKYEERAALSEGYIDVLLHDKVMFTISIDDGYLKIQDEQYKMPINMLPLLKNMFIDKYIPQSHANPNKVFVLGRVKGKKNTFKLAKKTSKYNFEEVEYTQGNEIPKECVFTVREIEKIAKHKNMIDSQKWVYQLETIKTETSFYDL